MMGLGYGGLYGGHSTTTTHHQQHYSPMGLGLGYGMMGGYGGYGGYGYGHMGGYY